MVSLSVHEETRAELSMYINRLSDWLFVASRFLNKAEEVAEVFWQSDRVK